MAAKKAAPAKMPMKGKMPNDLSMGMMGKDMPMKPKMPKSHAGMPPKEHAKAMEKMMGGKKGKK